MLAAMNSLPTLPYGAWPSSLGAARAGAAARSLSYAQFTPRGLLWIEGRPEEGGRNALMQADERGAISEPLDAGWSVRTRVHEYGGLPYAVAGDTLLFANDADQRLYRWADGEAPRVLTPEGLRWADGCASHDGRTSWWVREDHRAPGEPINAVVALDPLAGGEGTVLYSGSDFVAYPRISPDGRWLAFMVWDHPNMPWDESRLMLGRIDSGVLAALRVVAGGPGVSVLEPQWGPDGRLYFLSDASGTWNLQRLAGDDTETLTRFDGDLGGALWSLGLSSYALLDERRALVRVTQRALDQLHLVDLESGASAPLPLDAVAIGALGRIDADAAHAVLYRDKALPVLARIDLGSGAVQVVRSAGDTPLAPAEVSRAQPLAFPTVPGADGAPREAYAFFHPPCNPAVQAPAGPPPLMVLLHGGPTGHANAALSLAVQFWTSRGFAVVNVNYGGSSGHGRAYRERLLGQWGVVDVQDAVAAIDALAAAGRIDPARVAVRGGSAGGFTVLALLTRTNRFRAGINYFGVADLVALAADTHKFESRYTDRLIAPLPEGLAVYRERSPLSHLDTLDCALLTLQGAEDKVVPPAQSRAIVAAARERGHPVAYLEFEGEQHGFRRAENIARGLEAELYFLGRVFGFTPADAIEPVPIDNLPPA
jgi:dipeptidyl aminopeptidase/acylaminoacyl peptidase